MDTALECSYTDIYAILKKDTIFLKQGICPKISLLPLLLVHPKQVQTRSTYFPRFPVCSHGQRSLACLWAVTLGPSPSVGMLTATLTDLKLFS